MKKLSIFWIAFAVITLIFFIIFIHNADNYFDTMVKYEEAECNHRAYMIYKKYDDQDEETRFKDWNYRIEECAIPSAEYMSDDFFMY